MPHPDMNANHGGHDGRHPDEGLLHEWLDDQLSPSDAADMQAHIASCAECGARVAEARGLIAASHRILSALDDVPAGVIPANTSSTAAARDENAPSHVSASPASKVTSIDSARSATPLTTRKRDVQWGRIGSVAALLLVAATVMRFGLGQDVTVPVERVAADSIASPSTLASNGLAPNSAPAAATPAATSQTVRDDQAAKSRQVASMAKRAAADVADSSVNANTQARVAKPDATAERPNVSAELVASQKAAQAPVSPTAASGGAAAAAAPLPNVAATIAAAPPPVAVDQIARIDSNSARGFAAGGRGAAGGGRAGGGRGGAARATEPPVAAAVAVGTVSNAPPAGSATALPTNAPPATPPLAASPPLATPPAVAPSTQAPANRTDASMMLAGKAAGVRIVTAGDSLALRAEVERALRQPEKADTATRSSLRLRAAVPSSALAAARNGVDWIDSVTLIRTACARVCDTTTVHINAAGAVRYQVGSGNTQRTVMSQLGSAERSRLQTIVFEAVPTSGLRRGRLACSAPANRNAGGNTSRVQLFFDFAPGATLSPSQPCEKSESQLSSIAVRIETLVGAETLKRKLPPRE